MEKIKPNRLRQDDNLSKHTGPFKGKYYINGVYQPNKEIRIKLGLPKSGTIFSFNKIKNTNALDK